MSKIETLQGRINKESDARLKTKLEIAVSHFVGEIKPWQGEYISIKSGDIVITKSIYDILCTIKTGLFNLRKDECRSEEAKDFLERLDRLEGEIEDLQEYGTS